jgi:hypothetical protein
MSARHVWLGLSLMLGLAWGRAEAQQPQVQVIYLQQAPVQAVPVQTMPVEGVPIQAMPIQAVPIQAMPIEALPAEQPVRGLRVASWPLFGGPDGSKRDALNRRGYCCDSHIDAYGCQNWRTQCQFVFGSCRSFFGEPCRPAAPLFQGHRGGVGGSADCNR